MSRWSDGWHEDGGGPGATPGPIDDERGRWFTDAELEFIATALAVAAERRLIDLILDHGMTSIEANEFCNRCADTAASIRSEIAEADQ